MTQGSEGQSRSRSGLAPGTVLNNSFRIEKQLGEGGMGSVYLASNAFLEEDKVAIKVIRTDQAHDELVKQMFGIEVRAMLRLKNPRIVSYRTFAHDPELDLSFIVTEFINGPSLETLMKERSWHPRELCTLLTEICIGLRAAHNNGVVHRDMAPDNVLLEDGDIHRPKIIDFGIVKDVRQRNTIIGTGFAGKLNFVAPEQLGEPEYAIGPWTDIYSLALIIVGLARGEEVDMGSTPGAAIRHRHEPVDLSAVHPRLHPLLNDMLQVHPDNRIRSAEDVMMRIDEILRPTPATPPPEPEPDPEPEPKPEPDEEVVEESDEDRTVMLSPDQMKALYEPAADTAPEEIEAEDAVEEVPAEAVEEVEEPEEFTAEVGEEVEHAEDIEYVEEGENVEYEAYDEDYEQAYAEEEYADEEYDGEEYYDDEDDDEYYEYGAGGYKSDSGVWLVLLFAVLGAVAVIAGIYFGQAASVNN